MGTYLYDEALVEKIKRWVQGTAVSLVSPEDTKSLIEKMADEGNDNPLQLPFISIQKNTSYAVTVPIKRPMSYNGIRTRSIEGKNEQLTAIPITLQYQLDVYARYSKEADEYMRNLIFNIINYPELQVEIPYEDIKRKQVANIRIVTDILDSSSSFPRLATGQFTRLSVGVSIDDAYLWDVRIKDVLHIAPTVEVDEININAKEENK